MIEADLKKRKYSPIKNRRLWVTANKENTISDRTENMINARRN